MLLEFVVEVPAEQVRSEVEKAYTVLQRTARVRGYRPGKAPRNILSHLYGGRVHADVAQRLVDATLNKALAEQSVQPLSQPAIAPAELRPDASFSYKARFEVRPEISGVKWEGFEVKRPSVKASDEMVDAEIAGLRRKHATLQSPDPERPAKVGDVATITFKLEIGGEFLDQKEQEVETELGSGHLFKEIDEALIGMNAGEHKDVRLTFPAQHQNPELRSKEGVFHVTLKDLRERIYPEVDDEFAKDCGEESLEALRASQRAKVEKELTQKASDAVAEQLVMEICKANPIPVPPSLVDQQAQLAERELLAAARRQGQRLDSNADLRARVRLDSEMKVRAGLLMAEIAKEKEVKVTEADIEKGYEELAEQSGKNVAKVKAEYRDPKKRELLIGMILEDKILDMIEAAAKITDAA
ncbi:Cell division trigger factor [Chondromyces apiculatus DSM 436]|uniref:Trigger factor n=1 Tax=Chondromyces apiculatus DSM 436 TaxID=1192034 RepID=A0A017SV51_9BACT|nr:Cell division trigger factor [Chondromyces apiculatus DSM 436]